MGAKPIRIPSSDHPISVERNPARVIVKLDGRIIADTRNALTLREANYRAVQYIPREDVDMSLLARTDHATYCPFKGDASYFSIRSVDPRMINAAWTYETPHPAMAAIANRLAFYADRVEIVERPTEELPLASSAKLR